MPTQEERLTALEQKTAAHIQEMDENFTIMVGVIRHQGQDIKRIFQRLETIDERLNILETIDERLETTDKRLHTIEERLDRIETSFDEHTTLLTEILARLPKAP
jgi:archaellum component FlaC